MTSLVVLVCLDYVPLSDMLLGSLKDASESERSALRLPLAAERRTSVLHAAGSETEDTAVTFGDSYTFKLASTSQMAAAPLTASRFVLAYQDGTDGLNEGTVKVFNINGGLQAGTEYVFNNAQTDYIALDVLSENKFVVAYQNTGGSSYGTLKVGTVAGDGSVSFSSPYIFSVSETAFVDVAVLAEDKFVVVFQGKSGGSHYGQARIGSLGANNAVSFGSIITFNTGSSEHMSLAVLSNDKFIVVYTDGGSYDFGQAAVGIVNGTSITFGSKYGFNYAETRYISAAPLDENRFVAAYRDNGGGLGYGSAVIGEVDSDTIQYGGEYVFNEASTQYLSASALPENRFVVSYQDLGGLHYGRASVGVAADKEIAFGGEYVFNAAATDYTNAAHLADGQFAVSCANKSIGANYGLAVLGNVAVSETVPEEPADEPVEPPEETPSSDIQDGDLIRNPTAEEPAKFDVYIIKLIGDKKFKRLILSPHVFDSYGHLRWDDIESVDQSTMDSYTTSELVRAIGGVKVYRLAPSGDTGTKEWLDMTAAEFGANYDQDSIYTVNQVDLGAYMEE